jgi:hypothetical protein
MHHEVVRSYKSFPLDQLLVKVLVIHIVQQLIELFLIGTMGSFDLAI